METVQESNDYERNTDILSEVSGLFERVTVAPVHKHQKKEH